MKKVIKFLLGNDFLKSLVIELGDKLIKLFINWLILKLFHFHGRPWFDELTEYLRGIDIQDFFNDEKENINKII